jgi:hypothetical protein
MPSEADSLSQEGGALSMKLFFKKNDTQEGTQDLA